MKSIISTLLLLSLFVTSCQQKSKLQKEFLCDTHRFNNTETVADFKNKFTLEIPKSWKTQLYFNTIQTQIMTADTTKNLTNTFTINVEYNSGTLEINNEFTTKILKDLEENNLQVLKNKNDVFNEKPSFWTVSKGKKMNFDFYYFELFVKQNNTHYFKLTSDIYGNENLDERFCESIALMESLTMIE